MRKSCSSFRRSWMRHRLLRRFAVNAERRGARLSPVAGMIEVEIDGVTVRVGRGADAKTVTAVLRALKAGA